MINNVSINHILNKHVNRILIKNVNIIQIKHNMIDLMMIIHSNDRSNIHSFK